MAALNVFDDGAIRGLYLLWDQLCLLTSIDVMSNTVKMAVLLMMGAIRGEMFLFILRPISVFQK